MANRRYGRSTIGSVENGTDSTMESMRAESARDGPSIATSALVIPYPRRGGATFAPGATVVTAVGLTTAAVNSRRRPLSASTDESRRPKSRFRSFVDVRSVSVTARNSSNFPWANSSQPLRADWNG